MGVSPNNLTFHVCFLSLQSFTLLTSHGRGRYLASSCARFADERGALCSIRYTYYLLSDVGVFETNIQRRSQKMSHWYPLHRFLKVDRSRYCCTARTRQHPRRGCHAMPCHANINQTMSTSPSSQTIGLSRLRVRFRNALDKMDGSNADHPSLWVV